MELVMCDLEPGGNIAKMGCHCIREGQNLPNSGRIRARARARDRPDPSTQADFGECPYAVASIDRA